MKNSDIHLKYIKAELAVNNENIYMENYMKMMNNIEDAMKQQLCVDRFGKIFG